MKFELTSVDTSPVKEFITTNGPVRGMTYASSIHAILIFLPCYVLIWHMSQTAWSAPIELKGEFLACTESKSHIFIFTTEGMFTPEFY